MQKLPLSSDWCSRLKRTTKFPGFLQIDMKFKNHGAFQRKLIREASRIGIPLVRFF